MPPRKKETTRRKKQPEAAPQTEPVPGLEAAVGETPTTPEAEATEQEEFVFPRALGETIGTGPSAGMPYFLKAGDEISLDLRHRQFLMVPNMRLTSTQPTATIPEGVGEAVVLARAVVGDHDAVHVLAAIGDVVAHLVNADDGREGLGILALLVPHLYDACLLDSSPRARVAAEPVLVPQLAIRAAVEHVAEVLPVIDHRPAHNAQSDHGAASIGFVGVPPQRALSGTAA